MSQEWSIRLKSIFKTNFLNFCVTFWRYFLNLKTKILTNDSNSTPSIVLAASSADDSIFSNSVRLDEGLKIGSATLAKFKNNGELLAPSGSFIGQPSSGVGLELFPAGTTIKQVSDGTASNAVVTIKNDGTAYFFGALDAASIDGGTYA